MEGGNSGGKSGGGGGKNKGGGNSSGGSGGGGRTIKEGNALSETTSRTRRVKTRGRGGRGVKAGWTVHWVVMQTVGRAERTGAMLTVMVHA